MIEEKFGRWLRRILLVGFLVCVAAFCSDKALVTALEIASVVASRCIGLILHIFLSEAEKIG